ncbi:MAG TPA: hypothetical protein VK208_17075 [Pyrinomonadaceae bacterium]|jgi:hypothetical protein|nr:hypothetical protein [Pyrinomonadaceae bacterium]
MKIQILRTTAILGLFFMLAIASVNAQTPSRIEVNIPFDFSAGKATLKAGAYTIKRTAADVLIIHRVDGKAKALINAPLTAGSRGTRAGEGLVFNKYGDQYFLSQVWLTVETGRQLFTSDAEAKAAREYELAHNNAKPERVEIVMRRQ